MATGTYSPTNPATDAQIQAYWTAQYNTPPSPPGYISSAGNAAMNTLGVPLAPANARSMATFFGVTDQHIADLWKSWTYASFPGSVAVARSKAADQVNAWANGPAFTSAATDDQIQAVWRQTMPAGAGLIFAVPKNSTTAKNEAAHFATTPERIQSLWAAWVPAERPGEKGTSSPWSLSSPEPEGDLLNEWREALRTQGRPAVDLKGGVPMDSSAATRLEAFTFIKASRIQELWKNLIVSEFNGLLTILERAVLGVKQVGDDIEKVVGDVAKGNIGDAISDTGGAFSDAASSAWNQAKAGFADAGALASGVLNGLESALSAVKALALHMSPSDLIKLVEKDLGKFVDFLDKTLSGLFPTVTLDGKSYAWSDAKKKGSTAIWYLAAAAKTDSDKLQKSLFGKKLI